jgi:hypothetical protein
LSVVNDFNNSTDGTQTQNFKILSNNNIRYVLIHFQHY